jgi:hypothetical protein
MSNYINSFYTSTNNTTSIYANTINSDLVSNDEFNTLDNIDISQTVQNQINTINAGITGISYNVPNTKTIIANNLQVNQNLQSLNNQTSAGSNDYITKYYADSHYGTPGAGTPGNNAYVTVGTTTTLNPGSSATVTNSGTPSNAIFNFGIPAGVQGIIGATGATGATGPQGNSGQKGDQGDQASSTLASIAAAAASAASATSAAGSASSAAASAAAAQTNSAGLSTRIQNLENITGTAPIGTGQNLQNKTASMYHSTDISTKNHTSFTDYLEVNDSNNYSQIVLDGNNKSLKVNNIDTILQTQNLNIGTSNGILTTINIGNPGCLTQFNGAVNFGFNQIIGTISQF